MGRPPKNITPEQLQDILSELEQNGPLDNLNTLWHAAAKKFAELNNDKVSYATIMNKAIAWKLNIKTIAGKRGRPSNNDTQQVTNAIRTTQVRQSRAVKFLDSQYQKVLANIRSVIKHDGMDKRFLPLVKAIEKGSMKAAIKLNCIQCMGYQTTEVKNCEIYDCPLWLFRPYQRKTIS